ncbi:MAG: OmpH family outer membrane protein [Ignavibacteria bacterium]|nr:OmpH family outer membrane protein [Ignavibacteria bacterium]
MKPSQLAPSQAHSKIALPLWVSSGALIMCFVIVLGLAFGWFTQGPRIGYVRTGEVIMESASFKTTRAEYEQQLKVWQMNLDTLQQEYVRNLSEFNNTSLRLDKETRSNHESKLAEQRETIERYSEAISARAQQEEQRLSDSLLKTINASVEQFGLEHGYDLILGTTAEGSILYGSDVADVTKQVIAFINK